MAITRYAGDRFTIAAGETKPTGVLDGGYLIDTGNLTQFVKRTVGGTSQWSQLAGGGGGGTPGGSTTQVQFNDGGSFAGDADLTFTNGNRLNVNKLGISGNIYDSNNSIGEGGMVLTNEGTTGVNWKSIESVLSGVGGSGVANYVARWSDEDTLTTGIIYDNASQVGISTASPQAELHIYAGVTAGDHLLVESTNTAAGDAPDLVLYRNSPSPANSDDLGIIRFRGKNNGTDTGYGENKVIYADIEAEITSVVSGAEGGALKFYTQDNGSLASRMVITGANVGIGTDAPDAKLHVTNTTYIDVATNTGPASALIWRRLDKTIVGRIVADTTNLKTQIWDNNSAVVTIGSDQVGIGTDAPTRLLTLENNTGTVVNQSQLRINNVGAGDSYIYMYAGADWSFGIDNSDADKFKFNISNDVSDGTEVLTLQRDGNVGIGTNAPAAKLDLRSSDSVVAYIIRPSASPTVHIGSSTSAGAQLGYIHANDYAFFGHDAAFNAIVVNSSGSVGIGSTDPEEIVNVASAGAVTPGVINDLYSATTTRFPWIGLRKSGSNTKGTVAATEDGDILGKIVFKGVDSGSSFFRESASIIATASGAPDADTQPGMLQFATSNTTSNSVKMTITSSGFVGIGTVTPAYSLQANGTNGGIIAVTRTTANPTGTIGHFRFGADLANVKGIQDGAADSARLEFETQATGGSVATRMKISSAGAIQFNTYGSGTHTGTSAYKLSVDSSGNIIETSIGAGAVDGSGTANTIARWTDSDTIGDSLITVPSNTSVKINASGADAVRSLRIDGTNGSSEIAGFILENDGANAKVNLKYNIGNGTPATKVTLNHLGYVGINTTAPAIYLHNHGSALIGRTSGTTGGYVLSSYDLVLSNGNSGTVILLYNSAGAFQSSLIKYDANCLKLGLNSSNSTNAISTPTAVNVGSVGVGIGTVTPGALLEVYKSSGAVQLYVNSNSIIARLAITGAGLGAVGTSSNADFVIQRNGTTKITVASALTTMVGEVLITTGSTSVRTLSGVLKADTIENNSGASNLKLQTESGGNKHIEITPDGTGNVGIGIATPAAKLNVVLDSSATNTPTDVLRLGHTSTGSTAVGFGALIRFDGERTGSTVDGMGRLGFVADVMTASRVDGAFIVQTGADGTYTERMRITSTGNVGIGTADPKAPVHIFSNGSANTQQTVLCLGSNTSNRPSLQFSENQNAGFDTGMSIEYRGDFGAGGANGLTINGLGADATTSGAAIATFLSGGNVGVGTTNPAALLNLFKTGNNDAVSSAIYLQRAAGNYGAAILQVGNGSSGSEKLMFTAGHNSDPMSISNAKMTIQHDGNVGIGTTTPAGRLQVIQAASDQSGAAALKVVGTAYGTNKAIHSYMDTSNATKSLLYVENSSGVVLNITGDGSTNVNGNINFETMGQYLTFFGGGETEHSISSRNSSGNAADDLRINTFGALFINLDSNNNNTSGADFSIGRHGQTGAISDWLLDLSGETGKLQLNKYGSGTHTGTLAKSLGVDSSGNVIEFTGGGGTVDGSGTANYVAKWSGSGTIANSVLRDDGNRLAVGAAPSSAAGILHLKDVSSNQAKMTLESANAYNSWINFSAASDEMSIGYDKSTVGGFVFANADALNSNIRMVILSAGSVGIGTVSPSTKFQVHNGDILITSGKQLISTNSYTQAPPAMLTTQGPSTGATSLGTGTWGIMLGPQHTRSSVANTYYPGIAFNHLLNNGGVVTYNNHPQAWIGTRLHDTPGSERAFLVFSTKAGTGVAASDVPLERMCIDPVNGSVGIGTTDPAAELQIGRPQTTSAFTDSFIKLRPSSTTNSTGLTSITFGTSTVDNYGYSISGWRAGTDGAPYFAIKYHNNSAAGVDVMVMDRYGKVGIGTNAPDSKLEIAGGGYNSSLKIKGGASHTGIQFEDSDGNTDGYVYAISDTIGFLDAGADWTIQSKNDDYIRFSTNGNTEHMRIKSDGKVGIGTDAPGSLLTVSGNSDDGDAACTIAINDEDSTVGSKLPAIQFYGGGTTQGRIRGGDAAFQIAVGSSPTTALNINTANGYPSFTYGSQVRLTLGSAGTAETNTANWIRGTGANLEFNAASGDFNWEVGGVHRMRLTDTGFLGIGLGAGTDPFGQLHVNGTNGSNIHITRTSGGTTSTFGSIIFGNTNIDSSCAEITGDQDGTNDSGRLEFGTQASVVGGVVTRLTIKGDGNVGIGTDAPAQLLHVNGGSDANLRLTSASNRSGVFIDKPGTSTIMGSALVLSSDETYRLGTASYYHVVMQQGGTVSLNYQGNTKLNTTSGGVTVTGTLTETSSITLKENVETYTPSLDIINKIRPVKYNRKTNKDKKEIGLIAEELAELFPELVEKDEKGNPSSVNYSRAVTVLLGGFKELYKEIEELKKRI